MNQPTSRADDARLRRLLQAAAAQVRDQITAAAAKGGLTPVITWDLRVATATAISNPMAHPTLVGLLPDTDAVTAWATVWGTPTYPSPSEPWRATRTMTTAEVDGATIRVGVEVWGMRPDAAPTQADLGLAGGAR